MSYVTCITPTCSERAPFMELCRKYVARFTLQPEEHLVEESNNFYKNLKVLLEKVKTPIVAFIEDDDWYSPKYLKDMVERLEYSRRAIIGLDPTLYYHLSYKGFNVIPHKNKASLFTTVGFTSHVKAAYDRLYEAYGGKKFAVDSALWAAIRDLGVTTVGHTAIGIKHGWTRVEGQGHSMPKSYWNPDMDGAYLKSLIGEEDYTEYERLIEKFIGRACSGDVQGVPAVCAAGPVENKS